jgi:hypothetical protein
MELPKSDAPITVCTQGCSLTRQPFLNLPEGKLEHEERVIILEERLAVQVKYRSSALDLATLLNWTMEASKVASAENNKLVELSLDLLLQVRTQCSDN